MSAAPVSGSFRPFRLLRDDRISRVLWVSRASELTADWALLVALLALVYRVSGSVTTVGLFVLARCLPRAFVALTSSLGVWASPRALALMSALRVPLVASLALISEQNDLWWAAAVVVGIGSLNAASDAGRAALLPSVVPRTMLNMTNSLNVSIERLSFLLGPILGAITLSQWGADVTFAVAAVLLACATGVLLLLPRRQTAAGGTDATKRASLSTIRQRPLLLTIAASLFTSAAVAASLLVALIALATGPLERSEASLGILLASIALGMLAGPLTLSKLMGRLPVPFLLAGAAASLAGGMALISQLSNMVAVEGTLFLVGLATITNDTIATAALRRNVREVELVATSRAIHAIIVVGQVVGAAIVTLASSVWSVKSVLLGTGIIGVLAMASVFLVLYGGYYLERVRKR